MSQLQVQAWTRMMNVNIVGVLNAMAAVLPEFLTQKSGHIVVTSSAAGTRSVPGNAVYCGTKHFVRAILDSFRMEAVMEGSNIHATTIYPGAVKTELLNTVAPSETKTMVEQFYEQAGMTPDVIANAVLYALSQPDSVNVSDLVVRPELLLQQPDLERLYLLDQTGHRDDRGFGPADGLGREIRPAGH